MVFSSTINIHKVSNKVLIIILYLSEVCQKIFQEFSCLKYRSILILQIIIKYV